MAKNSPWGPTDEFVLSRWNEARDLSYAFYDTTLKLRRRFRRAGQQLEALLKSHGYSLKIERNWAEFKAYRPEWCSAEDEPLIVVAVGGLYPVGYLSVEEPAAYLALHLEGLDDSRPTEYRRFADLLYQELGGRPAEWQDRTDDEDWITPLWTSVSNADDNARIALARDQNELKRFALEQFRKFFAIEEPITRAVTRFRAG